jgi:hypothetical protein
MRWEFSSTVSCYRRLQWTAATHTYLFECMFRIRQIVGLDLSTAPATSPPRAFLFDARYGPPAPVFITFCGPQAHADRLSNLQRVDNPPLLLRSLPPYRDLFVPLQYTFLHPQDCILLTVCFRIATL